MTIKMTEEKFLELDIYTKVTVKKTVFGGQDRKMYRIAYYNNTWYFVWIQKDIFNKLDSAINKNGQLFKRYTGPVKIYNRAIYIGITPSINDGSGQLPSTWKGSLPRQ